MTKQRRKLLSRLRKNDSRQFGAVATFERTGHGSVHIDVTADDAVMFLTVGSRGAYKFLYTREPLGMDYTIKRGISPWRVRDFFKTVKRQRDLINERAAA